MKQMRLGCDILSYYLRIHHTCNKTRYELLLGGIFYVINTFHIFVIV